MSARWPKACSIISRIAFILRVRMRIVGLSLLFERIPTVGHEMGTARIRWGKDAFIWIVHEVYELCITTLDGSIRFKI